MKETIATLLAYLTCNDPVVQTKYENLIASFWHKDSGSVISSFSVNGDGDVTFNLLDGENVSSQIVIPQFVLPASMPMSFISGLVDALNGKVNTEVGRQLSTEDFTTELLNKLNSLQPYIHPEFHEISEINQLQDALDTIEGEITDRLLRGGYQGNAQNLQDQINVLKNFEQVADSASLDTNIYDLSGTQQSLADIESSPVNFKKSFVSNDDYVYTATNLFENNFERNTIYEEDQFSDLQGINPNTLSFASIDDEQVGGIGFSGIAMFDPNADATWVWISITFLNESDYDQWLQNYSASILSSALPRGLVVLIAVTDDGQKYAFYDPIEAEMSDTMTIDFIFGSTVLLKEYFVAEKAIGSSFIAHTENSLVLQYLAIHQVITVYREAISRLNRTNIYAIYPSRFDEQEDFFVKLLINSVEAEYDKAWLKVYAPWLDEINYRFKNGKCIIHTGFGYKFSNLIALSIDKDAEADSIEFNTVHIRDDHNYISPIFNASYYEIEYEMEYISQQQYNQEIDNHGSGLTQTGNNILISDSDDTHSVAMAHWVTAHLPATPEIEIINTNDEPAGDFTISSSFGSTYAKSNGCDLIVEAYTSSWLKYRLADPDLLLVVGHSSNDTVRADHTDGAEQFFNNIVMIGSGIVSDTDADWTTSYGYGVEFIEPTRIADAPSGIDTTDLHPTEHQQSPAAAFAASKFKAIKLATGMSWAIIRRACRETASNAGSWDIYRGYGVIDVNAAIAWISTQFGNLNQYLADRYANNIGVSQRLQYSDIHNNTPIPKSLAIADLQGAADPTTLDIPEGKSAVWKNTTNGEVRIWQNDDGTMIASAAFTTIP